MLVVVEAVVMLLPLVVVDLEEAELEDIQVLEHQEQII
jgi:hypothetical protein